MTKSNTDDLDEWIGIYERARTGDRSTDVGTRGSAKAERTREGLEAEAELIEQRLRSAPPLPAPLPDEYADDRKKPAQLRAKRDAWRAFRDRIREETGR